MLKGHIGAFLNGDFKKYKFYKSLKFYVDSNQPKKSFLLVVYEVIRLSFVWKCFAYHYFQYGFFIKKNKLSFSQMESYIPNQKWELYVYSQSKKYAFLCQDKALFQDISTYYNLPLPEMLFRFEKGNFKNNKNEIITADDAHQIIRNQDCEKIFVKDIYGIQGIGIYIFKNTQEGYKSDTINLDSSFFNNKTYGLNWIVQKGIIQHSSLAKMYPHAINTIRVITKFHNCQARVLGAVIRIAQGGMQLDNCSLGSLSVGIDIDTGLLVSNASSYYSEQEYEKHPDTHVKFKGFKIEYWEEIKEITINAAQKFNRISIIGWDIALTENGPIIIEMNETPGIHLMQMHLGGKKEWLD